MNNEKIKIPEHVGIILDGNRRWARERNLPTIEGHKKGYEIMKDCPNWFFEKGVKIVSVYAFSAENWNRSQEEVNYLMKLLKLALENNKEDFHKKGIRVVVSGRLEELPGDLPELCSEIEALTKLNKNGTLQICLNYSGRFEIIDMIKKVVEKKISGEQIHEGILRKYLYHGEISDPDIIIQTSGEKRLSGFLTWQNVYSELMFVDKYWPDFEKMDVENIINEYNSRQKI